MQKILICVLLLFCLFIGWFSLKPEVEEQEDVSQIIAMADSQWEQGAYGAALALYKEAAVHYDLTALNRLAARYQEKKMTKEYLSILITILQKYPDSQDVYRNLCEQYTEDGDTENCISLLESSFSMGKSSTASVQTIMSVLGVEKEKAQEFYTELSSKYYFPIKYAYTAISNRFLYVTDFHGQYGAIQAADNEWYIVNSDMKLVLGPYQDLTLPIGGDVFCVNEDNKWKFVDSTGALYKTSEQSYDRLWSCSGDVSVGCRNGRYYYLNIGCVEVFGPTEYATPFSNGVAAIQNDGKWYLIDSTGQSLGDCTYSDVIINGYGACCSGAGRIIVKAEKGYQILDTTGKTISDNAFTDAKPFASGEYAAVFMENGWGFVGRDGNILNLSKSFDDACSFGSNGLAPVKIDGLWGYIRTDGVLVIDPVFEDARPFSSTGIAAVKIDDRWQYIRLINE